MRYDDMPVGTVLRNPDDGDTYIRIAGLSGTWLHVLPGGDSREVHGIEMPPFLVELVEKPAEAPKLRDADGTVWIYAGQAYRLDNDNRNAPQLVLRTEIEADWGPVTEVTS